MAQYTFSLYLYTDRYGARLNVKGWRVDMTGGPITTGNVWAQQWKDTTITPVNTVKRFLENPNYERWYPSDIYFQPPGKPAIKIMWVSLYNEYGFIYDLRYMVYHQDGTFDPSYQETSVSTQTEDNPTWSQAITSYVTIADPTEDIYFKNSSTIQPLTYSVNGGTPVSLASGAQSGTVAISGGEVVTVSPILSTRPVTLATNGHIDTLQYGSTTYTQFPTTVDVDVTTTSLLTANGTPAPTITVDYTNTHDPVVTDS